MKVFWKLVNKILFSEKLNGKITSSHNISGPFNYSSLQINFFLTSELLKRFQLSLYSAPRFLLHNFALKLGVNKRIKFKFGQASQTTKLVSNNLLHNQPLLLSCYTLKISKVNRFYQWSLKLTPLLISINISKTSSSFCDILAVKWQGSWCHQSRSLFRAQSNMKQKAPS